MDLTRDFPRSPKETMAGIVMLARTIDKARAKHIGKLGEYKYDCPLDKELFVFLGADADEFAKKASELDDRQLVQWIEERFLTTKSPTDIEKFNSEFLADAPAPGSESEKRFMSLRDRIDASRTDVTTWPGLLDLEEGRSPRPAQV